MRRVSAFIFVLASVASGASVTFDPFLPSTNAWPFSSAYSGGRYQQAHDYSQFGTMPIVIQKIWFAPVQLWEDWEIHVDIQAVSTDVALADIHGGQYELNYPSDFTGSLQPVYNGLLQHDPTAGIFSAFVPTSLYFDPTMGRNLLLEITNISSNYPGFFRSGISPHMSRVYSHDLDPSNVVGQAGYALAVKFDYQAVNPPNPVPEPGTYCLFAAGLLAMAANQLRKRFRRVLQRI